MISPIASQGRMDLFAAPLEGMRRGAAQAGQAAQNIAAGDLSPENVVAQIQAETLVKANAIAAKTAAGILGSIIDLKA
jgi:hypothetical protein